MEVSKAVQTILDAEEEEVEQLDEPALTEVRRLRNKWKTQGGGR